MRKKAFGITALVVLSLITSLNISKYKDKTSLSDLALNNIEALAGAECTTHWSCWMNLNTKVCCNSESIGCAPCD